MGYSSDDGLVLIGGGGHALVIAEAALLAGRPLRGYLDDDPACALANYLGPAGERAPRLGTLADLSTLESLGRCEAIIALGDIRARRALIKALAPSGDSTSLPKGLKLATIIHPRAIVAPSATIEPGVFIGPGAIVHTRARVGAHAIVNSGAIVEHECIIGENVHVAPGAALGGRVTVESDTLVGLGSRVLPNLSIGRGSTVGGAALVVHSVGRLSTVIGLPAKDRDTD